jgi:hypothetical protein
MDIAITVLIGIMIGLGIWFLNGVFERDGTVVFIAGFLIVISGMGLASLSLASWNANGERLATERAACTEAGNLWAHDEEACITPEGWTVYVR